LSKGLKFEVSAQELLFVNTDAILLERVIRNLVDNAIKYTSVGGITLGAELAGDHVLIEVIDTGAGIPPEETEQVFEEFYQLSNPERDRTRGLGLGLAIVQRLTKLLGIELRLDSKVGEGSTFFLSLPRAGYASDARDGALTGEESADLVLPDELCVLVVDDEASIRDGMRMLFESWNWSVVVASDIATALSELDRQPIDLMLADYRLRGHATGVELIHAARERFNEVPALLISGDTAPDRLREADALGITLLHKPVSEYALRQGIAGVLRRHTPLRDKRVRLREGRPPPSEKRAPLSEGRPPLPEGGRP
jgi:CheY-like chemotaxis protein